MLSICIAKIIGCLKGRVEDDVEYESRDRMLLREDVVLSAAATDGESGESGASVGETKEVWLIGDEREEATESQINFNVFNYWFCYIYELISRCSQFCGRRGPFRLYCSFFLLFIATCILITCSVVNMIILCKFRFLKCRSISQWKLFFSFLNTDFV